MPSGPGRPASGVWSFGSPSVLTRPDEPPLDRDEALSSWHIPATCRPIRAPQRCCAPFNLFPSDPRTDRVVSLATGTLLPIAHHEISGALQFVGSRGWRV